MYLTKLQFRSAAISLVRALLLCAGDILPGVFPHKCMEILRQSTHEIISEQKRDIVQEMLSFWSTSVQEWKIENEGGRLPSLPGWVLAYIRNTVEGVRFINFRQISKIWFLGEITKQLYYIFEQSLNNYIKLSSRMIFRCEANWCIYCSDRIIGPLMPRLFIPKLASIVNLLHLSRTVTPYKGNPTHSRWRDPFLPPSGLFPGCALGFPYKVLLCGTDCPKTKNSILKVEDNIK